MFNLLAHLMRKKRRKPIDAPSKEQLSTRVKVPVAGIATAANQQVLTPPPSTLDGRVLEPKPVLEKNTAATGNETTLEIASKLKHALSFSNNFSCFASADEKRSWFVVSASATGKSHEGRQPCQDNHFCAAINAEWGIAISCDGAGSADNSHLGSNLVANELANRLFKEVVIKHGWHESHSLPSHEQWSGLARETCIKVYHELDRFAGQSKIKLSSLATTLIVVIYSPNGLLVTHIGDGRAGYCNEQLEWKPIMTPHKGEEANQTVFITSDKWITDPGFKMSGKPVPESQVITEKALAFTALSDGCELHSFECSLMDAATDRWHDPNTPYANFFNPLVRNLRRMKEANTPPAVADEKWRKFVERGSEGLESEPDDKTMILGITI